MGRIIREWLPTELGLRQRITVVRFGVYRRVEHALVLASTALLGLTGFPQMFHDADLARTLIAALGGIVFVRNLHHLAALALTGVAVLHLATGLYGVLAKGTRLSVMPTLNDVDDALSMLRYYLGMSKDRPRFGRFSYSEKLTYWTVAWVVLAMIVTGFVMWFPTKATLLMDGVWVAAAKMAHGYDAIFAAAVLSVWHAWQVHLHWFNTSIFSGTMSRERMRTEHPLEYARLVAEEGIVEMAPFTVVKAARQSPPGAPGQQSPPVAGR